MRRILIIGFGNPLRGDDGFGRLAAERLQEMIDDRDVQVMPLHQLTPELMEPISHADRVIFIDACVGPHPGEVHERRIEPKLAGGGFTHHFTPESLLAGARALYGEAAEGWLICVDGADFSCTTELSPPVAASLDPVIAAARRRV
jgi:hydrogenase maturation protease